MGKTKTTDVAPYETIRVIRARACTSVLTLEPSPCVEVVTTGEIVRGTDDAKVLLIVVEGMTLDLFEEGTSGGVGAALDADKGGLDIRLLAEMLEL